MFKCLSACYLDALNRCCNWEVCVLFGSSFVDHYKLLYCFICAIVVK